MQSLRILSLFLIGFTFFGCARYDYSPRGIHVILQEIPGVNKNAKTHIVKKGETLALIARTYKVDYKDIARLNGIKAPYTIYVGQKLWIRKGSGSASATRAPTSSSKKPPRASPSPTVAAPSKGSFRLIWPVKGRLSSKFGPRNGRKHDGIDVANKVGTPIVAAQSGEVVYADNKLTGYGNLIIIRHNASMFTAYAHSNRMYVSKGDKVRKGQHIADVGETGRVTGPHLHFELRRGDKAIDPLPYLPRR